MKESKRSTQKSGDELLKLRQERLKTNEKLHMQAYAKQMQDRESLLAKCRAKDDEQIRAGSEFAHRINSRISDADLRRNLSIKSAQKKHRDHNDTVTLKNSVQHEIDQ